MSVLVTGLLVAGGVLVGRLIARGTTEPPKEEGEKEMPANAKEEKPREPSAPDLSALPCQLGDVVLRGVGDEAWLAGAIVMRENGEPAAVLFFSPEAGGDRAVLARPASEDLVWLAPAKDAIVSGEPPTALEAGGDRFERKKRLPLRAERIGSGAPDVSGDVIFAEYTGLGDEHLVVVTSKSPPLVFRGAVISSGSYDVLPGKKD